MPNSLLVNRGLISVSGPDAVSFLDNLLTVSVDGLQSGEARYGALLTPQGKMIADGLIVARGDGFLIDCPRVLAADFSRRLGFYKLRANVDVVNGSDDLAVLAAWADDGAPLQGVVRFTDPRLAALGDRIVVQSDKVPDLRAPEADYHAHRIALGVPEGGHDFIYGDTFPHEADMDQLNGVDFKKGCFVGQEVVSRMQHRGTARTRCVPLRFADGAKVPEGTEALAGQKPCGRIGSSLESGLAIGLLRLDRVADAIAAGEALTADGHVFVVERRDWMTFEVAGI